MMWCVMMLITVGACRAEAPAGQSTEYTGEKELFIPMRDGVHLSTDVWRPKGSTGKLATVLVRTPYGKESEWVWVKAFVEAYLGNGYAVVMQDERGRNFSEGEYRNYLQGASKDGYD